MGRSGFSGGGGSGGGRDSNCSMPVEQYRKRIGKQVSRLIPVPFISASLKICSKWNVENEQDSKKEKKFVKDVVRKGQELKENTSRAFHESVRPNVDRGLKSVATLEYESFKNNTVSVLDPHDCAVRGRWHIRHPLLLHRALMTPKIVIEKDDNKTCIFNRCSISS